MSCCLVETVSYLEMEGVSTSPLSSGTQSGLACVDPMHAATYSAFRPSSALVCLEALVSLASSIPTGS